MKLRQYIREMVETELNEMAAIATLEKIKSPEKLEKFKKLYTGNENSLVSKLIDTIEKGSVKIVDAEKAASNPKAQEVIEFINAFNSKPGFKDHPIPVSVLTKEFGSIDDLISDKILSKIEGVTRNGMLVATNKSHTAGISPTLRQLSDAGILSNPKEEGEYIVPKKEKPESSGVKGRPTSEKVLMAKALNSKFEADSNYKPNEEELAMFADEPGFIEKLRMRVMGTLKRGPKNALKNAMKGLETLGDDIDGDGDVDNEDLNENKKPKLKLKMKKPLNEEFKRMQKIAGLITENENSEIKMDGDFTYLEMSANNLYEYLKNNFPELASLEKCMTLIEFVEENVAQDREDEDEEMELITMSVPEFWNNFNNFYGKF